MFSASSLFFVSPPPWPILCTCTVRAKPPIWAESLPEPPSEVLAPLESPPESPLDLPPEPPARADPDAAGRADRLCRCCSRSSICACCCRRNWKTGPSTCSASFRSATIRRCWTIDVSRRRRRQGLDLRHLFAAARQSQPYRLQRAVAVAVRQRAGAPVRRGQVFRVHGGDGGGRRAGASASPMSMRSRR